MQIDISQKAEKDNVLSKDNTEIFVPTENYNPATKKYVDDLISTSGGGDMLKTVYDKQNKGLDIYEYADKHIDNKNNPHGVTAEQVGALTNESLTKETILNKIDVLDTAHGGTGATTKKEAFANLAYLGNNPISSTEVDTPQKWLELGSGYAKFDTNNLMNNQPEQYMFVINYSHESSAIFQIGSLQSGNGVYYRTGNYSGWTVNWTPLLSTNSTSLLATTIQNLLKGGSISVVKSVQKGTLQLSGSPEIITTYESGDGNSYIKYFYKDITISPVDVTKSVVFFNSPSNARESYTCRLVNSTTLRIYLDSDTSDSVTSKTVYYYYRTTWQVVEFY